MEKIYGSIKLYAPLFIDAAVLGESFKTKIGNQNVTLYFPRAPLAINGCNNYLLPPTQANTDWKIFDDAWGRITRNDNNQYLDADVYQVYIECKTHNIEMAQREIYSNIDNWRDLLRKTIVLDQHAVIHNMKPPKWGQYGIELYPRLQQGIHNQTVTFSIIISENFLSKQKLESIFSIGFYNKKLKSEYDFLFRAYEERAKGNYQYSLVQAVFSVELCITNEIKRLCKSRGKNFNSVTKKASLGTKFDIIKQLGGKYATKSPQYEIVKPRNDLIHNQKIPSIDTLNDVLKNVRLYIDKYSPGYFQ